MSDFGGFVGSAGFAATAGLAGAAGAPPGVPAGPSDRPSPPSSTIIARALSAALPATPGLGVRPVLAVATALGATPGLAAGAALSSMSNNLLASLSSVALPPGVAGFAAAAVADAAGAALGA